MSALLGLTTSVLVLFALVMRPAEEARLQALRKNIAPARLRESAGPMTRVGRLLWKYLGRIDPWRSMALTDERARRLAVGLSFSFVLLFVNPVLGGLLALLALAQPVLSHRAEERARTRRIERQLSLVIDMYRLAVLSGLNVTMATRAIASRLQGPLPEALTDALRDVDRGKRVADSLEQVVGVTSEAVRPLIFALTSSERYGAPLSVVLERLAVESRVSQERRAEQASKRLSVQLLFPVAGCTLPAFALLTVAPLLAGGFGSLAL